MRFFKIISLAIILLITCGYVSNPNTNLTTTIEVGENSEAQFPGGKAKMEAWIKENLRLPQENIRYGIVNVEFTVKKSGKCSNFTVTKSINEDMDLSAVECLMGMPLWEPAVKDGKKVNSVVTIPIRFSSDMMNN